MPFGARNTRFWKGVTAVAVAGLAANSYATFHLNQQQNEQRDQQRAAAVRASVERDRQIRAGQIQNCHVIGEPIRHAQIRDAKQTVSDIKTRRQQNKSLNLHQLFPSYSRKRLHTLVQQGKKRDAGTINAEQDIIRTLQAAPPCEQRYPPVALPPAP